MSRKSMDVRLSQERKCDRVMAVELSLGKIWKGEIKEESGDAMQWLLSSAA
jgi:hypothetical protein